MTKNRLRWDGRAAGHCLSRDPVLSASLDSTVRVRRPPCSIGRDAAGCSDRCRMRLLESSGLRTD